MPRIRFFNFVVLFVFGVLFLGLANLSIIHGYKYKELSRKNCIRLIPQPGRRGRILDRHGDVIVDNMISYNLMVLPSEFNNPDQVLSRLSRVTGKDNAALKRAYRQNFVSLSIPVVVSENIEVKKAIVLEEMKPELSGFTIEPQPLRHYPEGELGAHVLGYLGEIDRWRLTKLADYGYNTKDIVGFGGAEEQYDYYLRQEDGGLSVEVDRKGRFVRMIGFRPAQGGRDIQLTLDLKIQRIAESKLADRRGAVIVMDPFNGEVMAMVSKPSFNPAVFVEKDIAAVQALFNDPKAPLFNRAVSGAYPAGSLFKLIIASGALENKKINLSTTFTCDGGLTIGRRRFACWNTHGTQNLIGAIARSCNVFFFRTGVLLGPQLIHDYAVKLGLSKPTGIDLSSEASGFIPDPRWDKVYKRKTWYDGDTANFSIGQGEVLVSPAQMACMIAVFANKGTLVWPHLIKDVQGRDISATFKKPSLVPIQKSTIETVRKGLRNVVADPEGTSYLLASLPVEVAGKTGTAQVTGKLPHGWFIGFFPFEKPRYALCVFLEHGGSGYAASVVAKEIIADMCSGGVL
ncbi:MAG: penicillin-binding protein 2 [Candidatus Omnitrophota bacterium]|nr:MAG: penicillin-binding protein 2 [Candidatus Omnitrophota bacterium]